MGLSLEDLMRVDVVSASASTSTLEDTAAAVTVLTAEDIRRSGARTLPELLRQVPGMEVARMNGHTWAVSARGFNNRFANLLLVLVDGRPIYTPTFGGVFWDAQNLPLWIVERVEVVRGPGGSLWGANAVNGVVNVITKDAAASQGSWESVGAGDNERIFVAARRGVALGRQGHLTLHAQAFDRETDRWSDSRGGFRWDRPLEGGRLSVQGSAYGGQAERVAYFASLSPVELVARDDLERFHGGHLMVTLETGGVDSGWWIEAFTTREGRDDGLTTQRVRTDDVEARHHHRLGRHHLTVGGGVRRVVDTLDGSFTLTLDPPHEHAHWYNALVQDDIDITDAVRLSLGTKVEWNEYTGREYLPSARALWRVAPGHNLWISGSRAVRVPTRSYGDASFVTAVVDGTPPTVTRVVGDPDFETASLKALEAGYRGRPTARLSVDLAAFVNRYDGLDSLEADTPYMETDPSAHLVVPLVLETYASGTARGAEGAVVWQAAERLRLTFTYTWLSLSIRPDATSDDLDNAQKREGNSPQQQAGLAVRATPRRGLELDVAAKVVDQLRNLGVPAYVDLMARVGWKPVAGLTLSLTGEHLLRHDEREFATPGATDLVATSVPRAIYARVTWAP
jgi:iron complex outermembrane receptor protein